jgi:dTDP-4-dehydrorhamnose 3,5-epimerase-like enzyme
MRIINLETYTDKRGNLTVIEKLPFDIKRIFYIYGVDGSVRGGHRHYKTRQAAICLQGCCVVNGGRTEAKYYDAFLLDSPAKCLIIEPEDWHEMYNFTEDAILMVLASTHYDEADYLLGCNNTECVCYRELYHKNNCAWYTTPANGETVYLENCTDYV